MDCSCIIYAEEHLVYACKFSSPFRQARMIRRTTGRIGPILWIFSTRQALNSGINDLTGAGFLPVALHCIVIHDVVESNRTVIQGVHVNRSD